MDTEFKLLQDYTDDSIYFKIDNLEKTKWFCFGKNMPKFQTLGDNRCQIKFLAKYGYNKLDCIKPDIIEAYLYVIDVAVGVFGAAYNCYRFVKDMDGNYYAEVKLDNKQEIMKCEIEHLSILNKGSWSAKDHHKNTYCKGSRGMVMFHTYAYPDFKEIDHINRNGLDNRKINIRDGSSRINANNKGIQSNNTSGIVGVYFDASKGGSWVCQWPDHSMKSNKRKKRFSVSEYGSEEAKNMAASLREKMINEYRAGLKM